MANPENAAGKIIHVIHDRLQKAQVFKDAFTQPQSPEEALLARIIGRNDTPIARTTESIVSPDRAQGIVARTEVIRNWIITNAPPYDEEPGSQVDDEEGWAYIGGGFDMTADDITKPSSLNTQYLLSIVDNTSLYEPLTDVWFAAVEDNKYNLAIHFFGEERKILHEYGSYERPFEEMPEDDAVIIEDLLVRATAHLAEQS